jgi:hypothetical protein
MRGLTESFRNGEMADRDLETLFPPNSNCDTLLVIGKANSAIPWRHQGWRLVKVEALPVPKALVGGRGFSSTGFNPAGGALAPGEKL